MNCTIWRSTSMSAPFSASSVNAIVAVVIVDISLDRLVGRTSTISGTTMATPTGDRRRRAASRFGLRPTRLAATKDLHHFLGHQPSAAEANLIAGYADGPLGVTRARWQGQSQCPQSV